MVRKLISSILGSDGGSDEKALPIRSRSPPPGYDRELRIELHPLDPTDGIIVKVQPPREPAERRLSHVPCDIVLVIDVSGSMGTTAPVPGNPGDPKEEYGLSVLDLVKHAALTILETLGDRDRLGIVTFCTEVKVWQRLIPMTNANKIATKKNIAKMAPLDLTNLWQGISEGLKLFDASSSGGKAGPDGRVPAVMVLTDGMPNFMCPPQGYIPKIRTMEQLPATIHTFGFGYSLRSGLLKSIAEIGGGNYAFIPDAGMIGTVFVHAVANLQSTYADKATLKLTYPSYLELEESTGQTVETQRPVQFGEDDGSVRQLTIALGNLQYGQSRDIYLRYKETDALRGARKLHGMGQALPCPAQIDAELSYAQFTPSTLSATARASLFDSPGTLSDAEVAYHKSRSALVSFLSTLYPVNGQDEHVPRGQLDKQVEQDLAELIAKLPAAASSVALDPRNASLLADLSGPEPQGQVSLAVKPEFWRRWGMHYLPSLAGAHARQVCNTFKDPGPLLYGADSPLFVRCRDRLDAAFDALPAPKPSNPTSYRGVIHMNRYNSSGNPCFAGCSSVLLAAAPAHDDKAKMPDGCSAGSGSGSGTSTGSNGRTIRVGQLRAGMSVQTPRGPRKVVSVLRTRVRREPMCLVRGLLVTPWHPVSTEAAAGSDGGWVFPAQTAHRPARYTGAIYSILLEPDPSPAAHAVMVGGLWAVTLGHGLVEPGARSGDVRAHPFLGSYDRVVAALAALPRRKAGLVVGAGVTRDPKTGLMTGFRRAGLSPRRIRDAARQNILSA